MQNFPTDRTVLKALKKESEGMTLTEVINATHPTFDYYNHNKGGLRWILKQLVKEGQVKEVPQGGNKGFLYFYNVEGKRQRLMNILRGI